MFDQHVRNALPPVYSDASDAVPIWSGLAYCAWRELLKWRLVALAQEFECLNEHGFDILPRHADVAWKKGTEGIRVKACVA
jgi:hypothetical protein